MDMAEKLTYIDEHYLSAYDALEVDSEVTEEAAFATPAVLSETVPSARERTKRRIPICPRTSASVTVWIPKLYIAFQILDYALCSAPGVPLKQALVDRGIGKDVYSIYENGIRQPYFSVVAKDTSVEKEQDFLQVTEEVLEKLVTEGFDEKALFAGINYYEFKYREADFGSYPKGLMYGLQVLDSWLYDDRLPFIHIEANDTFAELRRK